MIRYALRCADAHEFESWFRDSGSFDELSGRGLVVCPACGSSKVDKALMAPAVKTSRSQAKPIPADEAPTSVPAALPAPDDRGAKLRALMRELRSHIIDNSKDVGAEFAVEARKIHDGLSEKAAIHGVASQDEVRSLLEDGIEVAPLPVFPDDIN